MVNTYPGPTIEYMCTEFSVDSSRCFPFKARTDTDTHEVADAADRSTHAHATAGVDNYFSCLLHFRVTSDMDAGRPCPACLYCTRVYVSVCVCMCV